MKIPHHTLLLSLLASLATPCPAQDDAVQDAIRKFESARTKKPTEVTVVLEPPAENTDPATESEADPATKTEPEPPAEAPTEPPTEPPTTPEPSEPPTLTDPPPTPAETIPPPPVTEPIPQPESPAHTNPPPGISVSIRKMESGGNPLDTSSLKVLAPFPAKPLTQAPKGWLIEPSDNIPPYSQQVELEPGKTITLSVKPHVMVPDADGIQTFMVPEPGYNPTLEYQQNATIGAVLAGSLRQLDADSKQLGAALDQLEQLLISLPKPKARPVPEP